MAETKKKQKSNETAKSDSRRREMVAQVVRDRMDKTVVVMTFRMVSHPRFKKTIVKRKKFKAHDEKNEAKYGDKVLIQETRPFSKEKRWIVKQILEKSQEHVIADLAS